MPKTYKIIECNDCRFFLMHKKYCNFLEINVTPQFFCSIGETIKGEYCKEVVQDSTPIPMKGE